MEVWRIVGERIGWNSCFYESWSNAKMQKCCYERSLETVLLFHLTFAIKHNHQVRIEYFQNMMFVVGKNCNFVWFPSSFYALGFIYIPKITNFDTDRLCTRIREHVISKWLQMYCTIIHHQVVLIVFFVSSTH